MEYWRKLLVVDTFRARFTESGEADACMFQSPKTYRSPCLLFAYPKRAVWPKVESQWALMSHVMSQAMSKVVSEDFTVGNIRQSVCVRTGK